MSVGFTGTRRGLTQEQRELLIRFLAELKIAGRSQFRHGDCIGADAQSHVIALADGWQVSVHPPDRAAMRAFCSGAYFTHDPQPYLVRNHTIVDSSDLLVVCPGENYEEQRSGTWATCRYAVKQGKPVTILFPNGTKETR